MRMHAHANRTYSWPCRLVLALKINKNMTKYSSQIECHTSRLLLEDDEKEDHAGEGSVESAKMTNEPQRKKGSSTNFVNAF